MVGGTVPLAVLDGRDRWNVLGRGRGGLARQFSGLMAQAVAARVRIPNLRLIVLMPAGLASGARGVALRNGRRGGVDRRRVFRGGTVMVGLSASAGVLGGLLRGRAARHVRC